MIRKRILIACERSGIVRERFRALGHDAWSCDIEPAEDASPFHYRGDVLELLEQCSTDPEFWPPFDMMIAHPECRYLSSSGIHWNRRRPERAAETEAAAEFALALWNAPVRLVALENPVGILSTRLRKPDQIIQPYQFWENASKGTCLWLRGLPPLRGTSYFPPRMVCSECKGVSPYLAGGRWCPHCGAEPDRLKPRWGNQTDSGQNRLGPSPTRSMDRARTYPGIADAMATQWSPIL